MANNHTTRCAGVKQPVPMHECIRRAHRALSAMMPKPASMIAQAIWPDAEWRAAQGAGAAASRVLKRMEKNGQARWIVSRNDWGWIKTGELQDD